MASKRILMLLYKCFRFSEVMDQVFLTVRGAVQGYAWYHEPLRLFMSFYDQDGELGNVSQQTHTHRFFFLLC